MSYSRRDGTLKNFRNNGTNFLKYPFQAWKNKDIEYATQTTLLKITFTLLLKLSWLLGQPVINIIENPIFKNLNTPRYSTLYIICNLTMLVKNYVKPVLRFSLITFINLTWTIKLKIYISWNNTLLDYGIGVIHSRVANDTDLSCIIINRNRLGNTESIISGLIHTKVLQWVVSWKIDTWRIQSVISGLIQTEYYSWESEWVVSWNTDTY